MPGKIKKICKELEDQHLREGKIRQCLVWWHRFDAAFYLLQKQEKNNSKQSVKATRPVADFLNISHYCLELQAVPSFLRHY